MTDRYFLRIASLPWQECSKEDFIKAERAAGFWPKCASTDPAFMTTCATGGFGGSSGVQGRIVDMAYYKPEHYAHDPAFKALVDGTSVAGS